MDEPLLTLSSSQILKLIRRIKRLIDTVIPIEFDRSQISRPDSPILTEQVYKLLIESPHFTCENNYNNNSDDALKGTLVFALLIAKKWYGKASQNFLYDSALYDLRALACEYLAKRVIEREQDEYFLFKYMLCKRYTIPYTKEDGGGLIATNTNSTPISALELAVDMHATVVISSSGYERCMKWLWKGWIVQSDDDPKEYEFYTKVDNTYFWTHFHPDQLRTPEYQSHLQIGFSFLYLILYTLAVNSLSTAEGEGLVGYIGIIEWIFYIFTAGYLWDELTKVWDVGMAYIGFWNVYNDTLYLLVAIVFGLRIWGVNTHSVNHFISAYRILACVAPFIWGRLLLHLDSVRFFGAMLVVLQQLMKESIIFFVLLVIISGGFLQAFIGLDESDGVIDFSKAIARIMAQTVIDAPTFEPFDSFAYPYGAILYYIFTFLISTLLLNILVALFNSAYQNIYDNATDEYLALIAQKTLRFVRAPDEYVFVPPLNLIELLVLIMPLKWWVSKNTYNRLNYHVMIIVYFPFLFFYCNKRIRGGTKNCQKQAEGSIGRLWWN